MSINDQLMNDCRTLIKNNQTLKAMEKLIVYEKYYKRDLVSALNISLCLMKNLTFPNCTRIGIDACDYILSRDNKNVKAYYRRSIFYREAHNWYYAFLDIKTVKRLLKTDEYDELILYYERMHYETLQTAMIYEYEEDILYLEFFSTLRGHNENFTVERSRILFDENNKNGDTYFLDDMRNQIKEYYIKINNQLKIDKKIKNQEKEKLIKENNDQFNNFAMISAYNKDKSKDKKSNHDNKIKEKKKKAQESLKYKGVKEIQIQNIEKYNDQISKIKLKNIDSDEGKGNDTMLSFVDILKEEKREKINEIKNKNKNNDNGITKGDNKIRRENDKKEKEDNGGNNGNNKDINKDNNKEGEDSIIIDKLCADNNVNFINNNEYNPDVAPQKEVTNNNDNNKNVNIIINEYNINTVNQMNDLNINNHDSNKSDEEKDMVYIKKEFKNEIKMEEKEITDNEDKSIKDQINVKKQYYKNEQNILLYQENEHVNKSETLNNIENIIKMTPLKHEDVNKNFFS